MANNISNASTSKILKIVMYSLLFLFVAIVLYRYYGTSGKGGIGGGEYTDIPEEYQINYQPADFKPNVDEETALAIMSNPHRYRREF